MRAYMCTAYSKVTNTLPQLCIKCGVTKSCPGTHTALQVPMLDGWEGLKMELKY